MQKQWIGCSASNFLKGRPRGFRPEAIVVHIIVGSLKSAAVTFADPQTKRSAHYGVGRRGEVWQFVKETDTAYHAGKVDRATWKLIKPGVNPNFYTIGIEHEGFPEDEWPEVQYQTGAALIRELALTWRIPIDEEHVIPHRAIQASRTCPGFNVDLARLVNLAAGTAPVEPAPFWVRTSALANLRAAAPSTRAKIVRQVPAHTPLQMAGFTSTGEVVKNNPFWYRDVTGNYMWAGATDKPNPLASASRPFPFP